MGDVGAVCWRAGIGRGHVLTDPFAHLIDDTAFAPPDLFCPGPEWNGWEVIYRGEAEAQKRTTRNLERLPPAYRALFEMLRSAPVIARFSDAFRITGLEDDPTLHGGGLHVIPRGRRLAGHLDYALHPRLPDKERRVNIIAFLNPDWQESWGGALCLCDAMGAVVKRVYPSPGRLVAFETSDLSYHCVETVTGPFERVTAAVYYVSAARPGATRKRALYFPEREGALQ